MPSDSRFSKISEAQGVTILEVVIAVGIAGLLVALLGSGLQAMADRVNLNAAVSEVVEDLRYARALAVWERQPIQVVLDVDHPLLTILRNADIGQPVQPSRNLSRRAIRALESSGGSTLSFSPRGTSATPTTVTLEGRNGDRRLVTVSLTGIVRAR